MAILSSALEDNASRLDKGRASIRHTFHNVTMENMAWRGRLRAAIEESGKSQRAVSLASGNGPGYVHSILKEGKDPTIDNLLSVCQAIPADPIWIIHGVDATAGDVAILKAMQASPDVRKSILGLLSALKLPEPD